MKPVEEVNEDMIFIKSKDISCRNPRKRALSKA
jgi:hypothetical protein